MSHTKEQEIRIAKKVALSENKYHKEHLEFCVKQGQSKLLSIKLWGLGTLVVTLCFAGILVTGWMNASETVKTVFYGVLCGISAVNTLLYYFEYSGCKASLQELQYNLDAVKLFGQQVSEDTI